MSDHPSPSAPYADGPDELTPAWLTDALRAGGHPQVVVTAATERIGTGQMGRTYRLDLTYAGEPGPPSLIAKIHGDDELMRSLVAPGYRAELGFYRHLAPGLDVRTPDCWYAGGSEDSSLFTLLLADAAPAEPGVQADGCTLAQARASIANLVGLHAPRWADPSLYDLDFIMKPDPSTAQGMQDALVGATEQFVERYEGQLGPDDPATLRACAQAIGAWQLTRLDPISVVHGDYRLDNLLFGPGDDDVLAVDWQSVQIGPPLRDVAYFLGTSLTTELRRAHEEALVGEYHAALVAGGVTGYPLERCWDDYRLGHLQAPMIGILGCIYASGERSERSDAMFVAMATRAAAAIRDHRSLEQM